MPGQVTVSAWQSLLSVLLSRGMGSIGEEEGFRKGLASNVPGSGLGGAEQGFSVFYRCSRVLPGRGLGRPERSVTLGLEKVSFLGCRRRELPPRRVRGRREPAVGQRLEAWQCGVRETPRRGEGASRCRAGPPQRLGRLRVSEKVL